MRLSLLILILTIVSYGNSIRILGLVAFSGKSHNHNFAALTSELARRGHDVTVVTPFPIKNPPGVYRQIDSPKTREFLDSRDQTKYTELSLLSRINQIRIFITELCPQLLNQPEIKQLLNEKFDLVITSMFFNECFMPFAHHNQAPLILFSPAGLVSWVGVNLGNPEPTSYVPGIFVSYSSEMNFKERFMNTLVYYFLQFTRQFLLLPPMDEAAKQFFGPNTPSIIDLEKRASLALICTHSSLNYPRPLQPNIIEVGGMHITNTNQTLTKDLQDFMDGATDGVIYFSMGSMVKPESFSEEMIKSIIDTFQSLPQRVIWKWNLDQLPNQPKNVKLGKWLPQQAILEHPNLRLFITHGGLLSTQEAAHNGVPIVGIPVYGDQELNVKQAELSGFAVGVSFLNVTKDSLLSAIRQVLDNKRYAEKAKVLQKRVRDQPESPLERAVFWTEYVIRHDGAPHLRSAAIQLSWYQLYLLDVAAFIIAIVIVIVFIIWEIVKLCFGKQKIKNIKITKQKLETKKKK